MILAPPKVRSASSADGAAIVRTLARAFWSDPFLIYFYPDEAERARRIGAFFALLWRSNASLGTADVSEDVKSVAIWRPPGHWRVPRRTIAANLLSLLLAYRGATGRVLDCVSRMEAHHPREPHWYLMTLGTDPDAQGRGLGGAVVRRRLKQCDSDSLPCYLEAATQAHIPFYASFGFELASEVSIPGGPSFFPMWREPI